MGQAAVIALNANHSKAMIIPDVYHMYISEGGFEGLKFLRSEMIAIFVSMTPFLRRRCTNLLTSTEFIQAT
ncbi:MAG: hypothetical protein ACOH2A_09855 [Sphingobacteriaceae bacterium]